MTISEYKTKLNTHATTAGAEWFLYGWFDEINSTLREQEDKDPFIVVEPTQWRLNNRANEFTITFRCNAYKRKDTTREAAFDSMVTLLEAFMDAINTDSNLQIQPDSALVDLVDFGSVVENYYVMSMQDVDIEIIC